MPVPIRVTMLPWESVTVLSPRVRAWMNQMIWQYAHDAPNLQFCNRLKGLALVRSKCRNEIDPDYSKKPAR